MQNVMVTKQEHQKHAPGTRRTRIPVTHVSFANRQVSYSNLHRQQPDSRRTADIHQTDGTVHPSQSSFARLHEIKARDISHLFTDLQYCSSIVVQVTQCFLYQPRHNTNYATVILKQKNASLKAYNTRFGQARAWMK